MYISSCEQYIFFIYLLSLELNKIALDTAYAKEKLNLMYNVF